MTTPIRSVSTYTARHRFWRVLGYIGLALVLALAFYGYQSPDLRANWEALAALCGF